jgi:hypothetical protein
MLLMILVLLTDTIVAHQQDATKVKLPELADILGLRKGSAYKFFADKCLECVAGKKAWKTKRATETMTSATTKTDEAFALLLLENNYEIWRHSVATTSDDGDYATETADLKPKYTSGKKAGGSRRHEGWSEAGIERFNELTELVRKDRSDNKYWDKDYRNSKLRESEAQARQSGNKRKRGPAPPQRAVPIHDDLFSDDESDDEESIVV